MDWITLCIEAVGAVILCVWIVLPIREFGGIIRRLRDERARPMTPVDYAIVIAFLLVMALAGLGISRLIRDSDDIFVAGRELTPFILCATITSTNLSMFHFIGMGGTAYQSGASIAWQNWGGNIGLVLSAMFVVPIMRRLRIRSIPEFLEMRYSRGLRTLIGAFWGVRLCVYLGILIYIASTAAIIITGDQDTSANYVKWLLGFSVISVLYSVIGGAWAVAIMDSVQFCVMLVGALIILPIAAHAAGGVPTIIDHFLSSHLETHVVIVPHDGEYNWLYVSALLLLGTKWATVDQAILQRAFGARTPRMAAKGMVLSAVITTPFVFFWIIPGLAAARLHPGIANPDGAIPWLLGHVIPTYGRGLLGVALCGLIAAQISAITADVNSVATLFTSDVYRVLRAKELSQRHLVLVVRVSSLLCGTLMLYVAWLLRGHGAGAVRANLAVVGILDMPLFVITVIYGLMWRRANWQGATAGFLCGGGLGILTYFLVIPSYFDAYLAPVLAHLPGGFRNFVTARHVALGAYQTSIRNIVPFISSGVALAVTPVVSLLTARPQHNATVVWDAFKTSSSPDSSDTFHVIPVSPAGRAGLAVVFAGLAIVIAGIAMSAASLSGASYVAVAGMLLLFTGGLARAWSE